MGRIAVGAAVVGVTMMFCAAPAHAGPPPPGCERVPILGLNPQVREICDLPIQPDGSWERWRWFWSPQLVRSSCEGAYYQGGYCPPWLAQDSVSRYESPVDKYVVTAATIPLGEPGYIGG